MIRFKRRAQVRRTDVARLRRWDAREAPVAVVEISSLVGLPRRYVVVYRNGPGEFVVSRHRSKRGAVMAANRFAIRRELRSC